MCNTSCRGDGERKGMGNIEFPGSNANNVTQISQGGSGSTTEV